LLRGFYLQAAQPGFIVTTMRALIHSFLEDRSASSAAEYAMILAIVGASITAAAITLGSAISTAVATAAANMAWH
jgi:Flp pilus assembly pilin Flp